MQVLTSCNGEKPCKGLEERGMPKTYGLFWRLARGTSSPESRLRYSPHPQAFTRACYPDGLTMCITGPSGF